MGLAHTKALTSKGTGYADYQTNIRTLTNNDKAASPLPFDDTTVLASETNVGQETVITTITEADWGEGKDFYCESLAIFIQQLDAVGKGFIIQIFIDDILIVAKTFVYPLQTHCDAIYQTTIAFPLHKAASGSTVKIKNIYWGSRELVGINYQLNGIVMM